MRPVDNILGTVAEALYSPAEGTTRLGSSKPEGREPVPGLRRTGNASQPWSESVTARTAGRVVGVCFAAALLGLPSRGGRPMQCFVHLVHPLRLASGPRKVMVVSRVKNQYATEYKHSISF